MARVRALFSNSVSRILGGLASRSPRLAFFAADAYGAFRTLTARRPSRVELRALFQTSDVNRILRRFWSTHVRTQLLGGWIRRDRAAPIHALVRSNDAVGALRPPMIIGTFHIGPIYGLGVLSERLQGEPLVLRGQQFPFERPKRPNVDLIRGGDQERAATFHRAIERLRDQGFVILALDPKEAQRIAAPFLGGTLHLARGAFAMARIARVPIVPVVARWDGNAIDLIVGDPLPISDDEQALAASAARWLETYLRERPGELSYRVLELMSS